MNISTILIANRGEIASRIIRTNRKMGIKSIVVYSNADRNAPFVTQADMAIFIGESNPTESYLNIEKIIAAAKKTKADAIHPGYGFLSENAVFARKCKKEGLVFIGPNPEAIEAMGSKSRAKQLMVKHKVPVIPGYEGKDQTIDRLRKEAINIGFPLLLKATAGGGGKGMRIVHEKKDLASAIESAKREAQNAFGDDELLIEKYIASGRHIEFQIFGDHHGNLIHLLERECTIQRRYQKVVEESPSPVLTEKLREEMANAAIKAAAALNYDNAGTVEFIYDEKEGEFYFLEVNTRLQVEHPVTEEITGLDLVQMQIESAQGWPLTMDQEAVKGKGYAIEVRLYAEDALNNFLPVTGKIERFEIPKVEGLRLETAIESGSEISMFYDPMIAKLIVWDETRSAAHRKMEYVLRQLVCQGMTTNQNFLLYLFQNENFKSGKYNTHFISNQLDLNYLKQNNKEYLYLASIAACLFRWKKRETERKLLRAIPSGWRNSFYDYQQETYLHSNEKTTVKYRFQNDTFTFVREEEKISVQIIEVDEKSIRLEIDGLQYSFNLFEKDQNVFVHNESIGNFDLHVQDRFPRKEEEKIKGGFEAPMPSKVIKILVAKGQKINAGDPLLILSSMKMENTITADESGTVEEIFAVENANVPAGFLLLKLGSRQ